MRGYYNDIKKLDRRECQELIKYSNSEKEKELARQRILELEKIAVQEAKATIRIAKKKEEQNRKSQNRTSHTNSNREHQTYKMLSQIYLQIKHQHPLKPQILFGQQFGM